MNRAVDDADEGREVRIQDSLPGLVALIDWGGEGKEGGHHDARHGVVVLQESVGKLVANGDMGLDSNAGCHVY